MRICVKSLLQEWDEPIWRAVEETFPKLSPVSLTRNLALDEIHNLPILPMVVVEKAGYRGLARMLGVGDVQIMTQMT
jgi:hypothetical protein